MDVYRFQVVVERDEDGVYIVGVPALRSCHTFGETLEEALENIKEVISMCLQEMKEDGESLEFPDSRIVGIETVEVEF